MDVKSFLAPYHTKPRMSSGIFFYFKCVIYLTLGAIYGTMASKGGCERCRVTVKGVLPHKAWETRSGPRPPHWRQAPREPEKRFRATYDFS